MTVYSIIKARASLQRFPVIWGEISQRQDLREAFPSAVFVTEGMSDPGLPLRNGLDAHVNKHARFLPHLFARQRCSLTPGFSLPLILPHAHLKTSEFYPALLRKIIMVMTIKALQAGTEE